MNSTRRGIVAALVSFFALAALPRLCWGDPIDPREVNLALQSYVTDMELSALNIMYGIDTNTVYRYGVDIGPNDWSGTLLGTHLGEDLTVNFSGTVTPTSPTTADIAFASNGFWGNRAWETDGVWNYTDPNLNGSAIGNTIRVSIGGQVMIYNVSASLSKDLIRKKLSSDVTVGVGSVPFLGSAVSVNGNFTLDQSTGVDSSSVRFDLLFGLFTPLKRTLNTTQLFSTPTPPATIVPPPISSPNFPTPKIPSGGSPGFSSSNPNQRGYDSGYVRSSDTPEPASLDLLLTAVLFLGGVHARRCSSWACATRWRRA